MRHHLEKAALYAGDSNHGFSRGQMQAMSAAGMLSADLGKQVQIVTAATVEKYLDLFRHLPRLERSANFEKAACTALIGLPDFGVGRWDLF